MRNSLCCLTVLISIALLAMLDSPHHAQSGNDTSMLRLRFCRPSRGGPSFSIIATPQSVTYNPNDEQLPAIIRRAEWQATDFEHFVQNVRRLELTFLTDHSLKNFTVDLEIKDFRQDGSLHRQDGFLSERCLSQAKSLLEEEPSLRSLLLRPAVSNHQDGTSRTDPLLLLISKSSGPRAWDGLFTNIIR